MMTRTNRIITLVHLTAFWTVFLWETASSQESTLITVPSCSTTGWFGSGCKYKCRCRGNNCDNNGTCIPGSRCVSGWFGPACQYVDLVWNNTTRQTPNWLYDDNNTTCNPDKNSQEVTVTFSGVFYFTWLRLHVTEPGISRIGNFQVKTFINSKATICSKLYSLLVNDTILDIHCDPGVSFRQISITGEGVGSLCSLYISGGRNVALKQNTTQSSTYMEGGIRYTSNKGVDGSRNSFFYMGSCTHTNKTHKPEYWTLTFPQTHHVSRYVISNREDWNKVRLGKFVLAAYQRNASLAFMYKDNNATVNDTYYIISNSSQTEVISVTISVNEFLTLCEVEMYGDIVCQTGTYGPECLYDCNCAKRGDKCFVSTGGCASGCAAGYQGEDCKQSCSRTFYGINCAQKCSPTCINHDCRPSNGHCYSCINGTHGPTCESGSNDESLPVGAIIGAVVGLVVLALLIVIGVIIWRRLTGKTDGYRSENNMNSFAEFTQYNSKRDRKSAMDTPPNYSHAKQTSQVKDIPALSPSSNNSKSPTADGTYYNTASGQTATSIKAGDMNAFMIAHTNEYFLKQFTDIPANTNATTTVALRPENQKKNRYKNISAYDHSRVHLQADSKKKHGDYINASYINGYKKQKQYIASQGPSETILEDFVRMLWEQEVAVVVMLTNLIEEGKLKCVQYWPNDDQIDIGEITIKLTTTQVFADYTIRRLQLFKGAESGQNLTHFHFTTWPDKDVPTTAWGLVELKQRIDQITTDKPIVVHCSAGVGRTGTFIALHNVLEEIEKTGHMDFFTTVQKLRNDRINMVQTSKQYEFLHKAAQIALVCMDTTVTSNNIQDRIQTLEGMSTCGQFNIEKEFKSVCLVCDEDDYVGNDGEEQVENVYYNSRALSNKMKNRLNNVLPKDYYRPNLACEIHGMETYINAVFIPSFKRHNRQFLTQLPLPTTIIDFWRLVTQYNVGLVVAFERELMAQDTTIGDYLTERDDDNKTTSFFNIKIQSVESGPNWDVQRLVVTIDSQQKSRMTKVAFDGEYCLSHIACRSTDFEPESLLELVIKIRSMIPVGDRRILYMCRNGAKFSGLVCTMSLLLDRMDNDQHVSVPLVLGSVKAIRPQVVATLDQYRLLYQALNLYTETNNDYSNFGSS